MRSKTRRRLWIAAIMLGLLAGLGITAAVLVTRFLDDLPALAAARLEERFGLLARIEKASYSWPTTISIEGVALSRKSDGSPVVSLDRIVARCKLADLLAGELDLESLLIDGVALSLREDDADLLKGGGGSALPALPIQVRNVRAELSRGPAGAPAWLALSGVAFTLEPQASGCLALEGAGENSVMGRFTINGLLGGDLVDSRVTASFPHVRLGPELRALLPAVAASVWNQTSPEGNAALQATLSWFRAGPERPRTLDVAWRLSVDGAAVRIPNLATPITDISAVVEGTADEFNISEATGNYVSALLNCRARSVRRNGAIGVRLRGTVRDLEPTPELLNLLPDDMKRQAGDLRLSGGQIDADLELRFSVPADHPGASLPKPEFVRVNASIRDGSLQPAWFPYRLSRVSGALSVATDEVVITSPLVGWHDAGSIKVTGAVGFGERECGAELVVVADGLAIDADLDAALAGLSPIVHRNWRRFALSGGSLDATITATGPLGQKGGPNDWAVRLAFDGTRSKYVRFPYALDDLSGHVEIRPEQTTFRDITGRHGDGTVRIDGSVDTRPARDKLDIVMHATNVKLDADLEAALGPHSRAAWARFQPAGLADFDVLISTGTSEEVPVDTRVNALVKRGSVRLPIGKAWLPVTDLSGRVEFFGDVVRVAGVTGQCLGGTAAADGVCVDAGGLQKLKLEITGDNLALGELLDLLPEESARKVRLLRPSGRVSLRATSLDAILRAGQPPDLQYRYVAEFHDAALSIPMASEGSENGGKQAGRLDLSEITGRLTVENDRSRAATGSFDLDKVRLAYGTMRNVSGKIRQTGPIFSLEDVRGDLYGGQVSLAFRGATDLLFFSAHARATGMDVARICRETGISHERVWGDLGANVYLNGERITGEDNSTAWRLSGSGSIGIDRANLGETPLVKSILSYKALLLGEQAVVQSAQADFQIESRRIVVDRLVLSGPSASTRGVGSIGFDKDMEIDLYFYRKSKGGLLPPIPVIDLIGQGLSWVVDQIQDQLVLVHVSGTLRNPKIEPAVLKTVRDQIQRHIIFNLKVQEEEEQSKRQPKDEPRR